MIDFVTLGRLVFVCGRIFAFENIGKFLLAFGNIGGWFVLLGTLDIFYLL